MVGRDAAEKARAVPDVIVVQVGTGVSAEIAAEKADVRTGFPAVDHRKQDSVVVDRGAAFHVADYAGDAVGVASENTDGTADIAVDDLSAL